MIERIKSIVRENKRHLTGLALAGRVFIAPPEPVIDVVVECPVVSQGPVGIEIVLSGADSNKALALGILNKTTTEKGIVAGGNIKSGYRMLAIREPRGIFGSSNGNIEVLNNHEILVRGYATDPGLDNTIEVARKELIINCP